MLDLGVFQERDVLADIPHEQHGLVFREKGRGSGIVHRDRELKPSFRPVPQITFLEAGENDFFAVFNHILDAVHIDVLLR